MFNGVGFRHFGGGNKGIFLVLRYVFITVAAFHDGAQAVVGISAQPSPLRARRSFDGCGFCD